MSRTRPIQGCLLAQTTSADLAPLTASLLVNRLKLVLDRPIECLDRHVDIAQVLIIELHSVVCSVHPVASVQGIRFPFPRWGLLGYGLEPVLDRPVDRLDRRVDKAQILIIELHDVICTVLSALCYLHCCRLHCCYVHCLCVAPFRIFSAAPRIGTARRPVNSALMGTSDPDLR